jgi:hypothetical protein
MVVEIRMHIDPKPQEKFVKIMSAYRDSQGPLSQPTRSPLEFVRSQRDCKDKKEI